MPLFSRRSFLTQGLGLGSLLLASACTRPRVDTPRDALPPTPATDDDDDMPPYTPACAADPTADNIEGPFYKAEAPHRASLVSRDDEGERLVLTGSVRSTSCAAAGGALLDIWQANARGDYDLDGFRFRGQVETDADGRFELRTIIPGRYLNGKRYRPAHIHVKVRVAGRPELTTQLYFEGDPYNEGDPFIVSSLVMPTRVEGSVRRAAFDFVV